MNEKTIEHSGRLYKLESSTTGDFVDIDYYNYKDGETWEDLAIYHLKDSCGKIIGTVEVSNSPNLRNGILLRDLPRSKGLEAIGALVGRKDYLSCEIRSRIFGWPEANTEISELIRKVLDGKA